MKDVQNELAGLANLHAQVGDAELVDDRTATLLDLGGALDDLLGERATGDRDHLEDPPGILGKLGDATADDLVETGELDPKWNAYNIPATRFAEEIGNTMMANIVMLGFLSALSDVVTVASLREAVLSSVPPHTKEKNEKAFNKGNEYGEAILKSAAKQSEAQNAE